MTTGTKRWIGAVAGGFVGSVIYVIYLLTTPAGVHFSGAQDIVMLPLPGLVAGAVLGAIFPKPFFKLADLILQLFP